MFTLVVLFSRVTMAAGSRLVSCRLCPSQVERSRCTDIFRIEGNKQGLLSRLSKLLLLLVDQNDRLPRFICCNCKLKFNMLETKIESFRAHARSSYKRLNEGVRQRKRTKDTSSNGISPFTARPQPPAKRLTATRCLFPVLT